MKINFTIGKNNFFFDSSNPLDISIPLQFNGEQPNSYDVPKAESAAVIKGDFVGDTRKGGSCNFEQYTLIPHCNGTHTECIGHITDERISVAHQLKDAFIPSTLISVTPISKTNTNETYDPPLENVDMVLTKKQIQEALTNSDENFLIGLIIRTLPNPEEKKRSRYLQNPPAFFSLEAMSFINEIGVQHLLVDLPSVDRTFDKGLLNCHHIFWNMEKGSHNVSENSLIERTITEMIFIRDSVKDGRYLLNLQITSFRADASPSRPILFKIENS